MGMEGETITGPRVHCSSLMPAGKKKHKRTSQVLGSQCYLSTSPISARPYFFWAFDSINNSDAPPRLGIVRSKYISRENILPSIQPTNRPRLSY